MNQSLASQSQSVGGQKVYQSCVEEPPEFNRIHLNVPELKQESCRLRRLLLDFLGCRL